MLETINKEWVNEKDRLGLVYTKEKDFINTFIFYFIFFLISSKRPNLVFHCKCKPDFWFQARPRSRVGSFTDPVNHPTNHTTTTTSLFLAKKRHLVPKITKFPEERAWVTYDSLVCSSSLKRESLSCLRLF
ncbi:V-type proton ATPase subunit B 1-like [Iris pallida]|uniref:V-type proton ATPase subunit B 1-like n=1 Tax=Iris pallida TaxID=29817 RepID=A0AAX6F2W6_IRIPA|nr:V-type proton ATPase subunit B 1-like [Iris pallida]